MTEQPTISGIIEVLNRSGQVLQRALYSGGAVKVGRAFDNDIIIGDAYVCPHHLEIRQEGDALIIQDQQSVNGTWVNKGRKRIERADLAEVETVQIGHSQLRFHTSRSKVVPTWKDMARARPFRLLDRVWVLALAVLACIGVLAASQIMDNTRELVPGVLVSLLVYPLLGVVIWAAVWSMVNRLVSNRANFAIHLSIASLGIVAFFVNAQGIPLLAFAFGWIDNVGLLVLFGQMLITCVALYTHMQFATHGKPWGQALISVALAAVFIGAPSLAEVLQQDEFSSLPRLAPLLRPPSVRITPGETPEAFFEHAEKLREQLGVDQAD